MFCSLKYEVEISRLVNNQLLLVTIQYTFNIVVIEIILVCDMDIIFAYFQDALKLDYSI